MRINNNLIVLIGTSAAAMVCPHLAKDLQQHNRNHFRHYFFLSSTHASSFRWAELSFCSAWSKLQV